MTDGVSSARPARLVRFGDTAQAAEEALRVRFGLLDEALARYRATCEPAYRLVPTVDTAEVLRAWGRRVADLGDWTRGVGHGFIASQVVEIYMDGDEGFDPEDVMTKPDREVIPHLDDRYQDDPFLGVPAGGWVMDDREIDVEDPDAFAELLERLGLPVTITAETLKGFADLLERTPRSVTVTVSLTETHVLFMADGRVLAQVTRAEATARLIFPGHAPPDLIRATRWIGRVGGALDFATGAYAQWVEDANLPDGERVLRAGTKGLGVLGGGALGGFLGGAGGGAAAGLICGPGAPVCSTVLLITGGILGAIGGSSIGGWLVDLLPWMDDPPEPKPGEYDLEALHDEIAQDDSALSEHFAPIDAATDLTASDLAMAETADRPDVQEHLEDLLPDRDELTRIIESLPHPDEITPTGTTTTTSPAPPPSPSPSPSPSPGPSPTTSRTTVATG